MTSAVLASNALRGLAIAGGATLIARTLIGSIDSGVVRTVLISWLAMPALVVAYTWAAMPAMLLHQPWAAQVLHALLSMLRLAPVGLIIASLAPSPPLSAAALHCLVLSGRAAERRSGHGVRWNWWIRGPGRRWLLCLLLLIPPAFAEFEIGSRLAVGCWSVRLFDAQAGGQFLSVTLMQALPGCGLQALALGAAWWLLTAGRSTDMPLVPDPTPVMRSLSICMLCLGSLVLVIIPTVSLASDARSGMAAAITQAMTLRSDILASLVFAVASTCCAWLGAGMLIGRTSATARLVTAIALVPGLCGSLVVGLALLAAGQLPGASLVANGPLPLVAALVLLLMPVAVTLRLLADQERGGSPWRLMHLLQGSDDARDRTSSALHWSLGGRKRWWALVVMFLWAYGDLAASTILHPVDMTPVLVRLYNLMHYGRSTALSVQLVMALVAATVTLVAVYVGLRIGLRLRQRLHHRQRGSP